MDEMTKEERARRVARIYSHAKSELVKRHQAEFNIILDDMYLLHGDPRVKKGKLVGELAQLRREVARLKEMVGE